MNNEKLAARPATTGEAPPENGLRGLRHWRYDLRAATMVSLNCLPLYLGIAHASGAPAVSGLISAIIAGLVFPCVGGTFVAIAGPAAGLAPVLLSSMRDLGAGSLEAGYPLLLVVILATGMAQLLLTMKPVARWVPVTQIAAMLPRCATAGMVAAIGLLLIKGQIPHVLGVPFKEHEFFAVLAELPSKISMVNGNSLIIATACLFTMFTLSACARRWKQLRAIPPHLITVVLGTVLVPVLGGMSDSSLIHIPDNLWGSFGAIAQGFKALAAGGPALWGLGFSCFIFVFLVDTSESLPSMDAIDKKDPYRRKSNPLRTMRATGMANLGSSLLGGLTIIPNVIPSAVNIAQGGRTSNANFFNAICLILYAVCLRHWINMIPFAALGAVLIYVGWNLCKPVIWFSIARASKKEFLAFFITVWVSLQRDLLQGLLAGTVVHYCLALLAVYIHPSNSFSIIESATCLFRNPIRGIVSPEEGAERLHVKVDGPLTCFNIGSLLHALEQLPDEIEIYLLAHLVPVVDCGAADDLSRCQRDLRYQRDYNDSRIKIKGLDLTRRLLFSGDH
jgi:carbonic anhydrase